MSIHYHAFTDSELVARLRVGDELAFSTIYDRYWDKLFVVSAHRIGDQQDAEECVQDVFFKLWSLRETFTMENEDLGGYLAVAVRNQVFNRRLKRHREKQRAEGYTPTDTPPLSPEQEFIVRELQKRIDQAIAKLPEQCRIVFELRQKEGLNNAEIAEKLNISENTVKYHLKKANRDIRNNLEVVTWLGLFYHFFTK